MDKDGLTGLLLRGQYEEDFKTFKQNDLCVVYFDINNLKKTNDNLGHRFGDKLIIAASECLKSQFRNENIYRTGGDEFIVLANGIGPSVVEQRLKNIKEKMDEYTKNDEDHLVYQIAAGYCVGDGIMTKQEIEEKAESNMYLNKKVLKGETKKENAGEIKKPDENVLEEVRKRLEKETPRPKIVEPEPEKEEYDMSTYESVLTEIDTELSDVPTDIMYKISVCIIAVFFFVLTFFV